MKKDPKAFKQVNIAIHDWDAYNIAAMNLSVKRGKRVSIPALLKESYDSYMKSLQ